MQVRFEERLNQAVSEGKIPQEQKEAIMAKKGEMKANRGEFKDLTPEERRKKMETHADTHKNLQFSNTLHFTMEGVCYSQRFLNLC